MSTEDVFKRAATRASEKKFPDPSSSQKLQLYGLYKQSTKGPCSGSRPGMTDPVGRAKYDAWAACEKLSLEEARLEYIALVKKIDSTFTTGPSEPLSPLSSVATTNPISTVNTPVAEDVPTPQKAVPAPIYIKAIDVPKFTDLEDDQGFRFTVYNIRVTQSDGKVWTIGRRYNEISDLYAALSASCKHPKLKSYKFPNKSMLNTFAMKTLERRRTGFVELFDLLLTIIREGRDEPINGLAGLLNVPPSWFRPEKGANPLSAAEARAAPQGVSPSTTTTAGGKPTSLPLNEKQIEEQSLRRQKRVASQRGFSFTRFISTFLSVVVGLVASGGAGFFDLNNMDWTRAAIGSVLITMCAILLVDFLFMRHG
jgi:acyl-CoA-binding protein